jgi:hypothetical protein
MREADLRGQAHRAAPKASASHTATTIIPRPARILVVDDDPIVRLASAMIDAEPTL